MDDFAHAYGWSKETTFALYWEEVPIYRRMIARRAEEQRDHAQINAILAASAPHMEDGGKRMMEELTRKYRTLDTAQVDPETIKRDLAIARQRLGL